MVKPRDKGDALLDEQGDGSFPASDPPSSNVGERIGEPKREDLRKPERKLATRRKPAR
ncbi:MAG TPA: hypothetical protein VJR47_01490 [Stellaceae bacterium]|nr:hypothetical protein [Stellaceae bacterium]